jgi:hypothetical protein
MVADTSISFTDAGSAARQVPQRSAPQTAPGKRFCSRLSATVLLCLGLLTFALPGSAVASGPLDSLRVAQQGIDQCDPDLFRQAVDVDAVYNNGFDTLLSVLADEVRAGNIGGENALLAMAVSGLSSGDGKNLELLKQLLSSEVKSFVTAGISGGYFAGEPNGKVNNAGAFSSLLKDISKERKQLVPGKVLSQKGNEAVISARLVDGGAGTFPLKLKLENDNGRWQVKEVLNARELLQEAYRRR